VCKDLKYYFQKISEGQLPMALRWPWPSGSSSSASNFQPELESMAELVSTGPSKPMLSETLSMPLLNYSNELTKEAQEDQDQVEIGSGDEEFLLPTDLLNDDDDIHDKANKPGLRKTWSCTHADEDGLKNSRSTIRHLERAIKSLSIDPNVSSSRKF
jgi:hypothetical protein